MTGHPPTTPLRQPLARAHAAVRRALALRSGLGAAARVTLALAGVVVLGLALPLSPATAWLRLALFGIAALVALGLGLRRFLREAPRFDGWLEQVEARFPETRSWLRNALDMERRPDPHTSAELASALRAETARKLTGVPLRTMVPRLQAPRALAGVGVSLALLAACTAFAPEATSRAWRTLWDPEAAAPPVALEVEPGSVTLSPGATLAVRATVTGSDQAPRLLGEGANPTPVLESDTRGQRRWRFDLPPVTAARDYAVRVQRTESPRYQVALAGEPQPVSFAVELTSPAYARLPVQLGQATRGDLSALAGSRASVEVTFDRDLESLSAQLPDGRTAAWQAITPRRWKGDVPVLRDGGWSLAAEATTGRSRHLYRISVLADAPPLIAVTTPDGDVDVPAGQQVPYDVQAQDDLGLSELRLEWKKGDAEKWSSTPLASFEGTPREVRAAARWDATSLGLLPGESATFRFVAWDNDAVSGRKRAESPEFKLRFPSLAELYAGLDDRADRVQKSLEKVAEQAKEMQRSLEQMQRQPQRGQGQPDPFQRAEEMKRAVERQQQMSQRLEQAAEQMRQRASDAAEREAFREELQTKLREMADLMRQIESPEFKDAVKRLQEAIERADRREAEQALPQMRQENKDLLKNLERALELLKQLREEERMESLGRRAEELKKQQDALNDQHAPEASAEKQPDKGAESESAKSESKSPDGKSPKSEQLAKQQKAAAEQSEQLAQDAKDMAEKTETPSVKDALEEAASELSENAAAEQSEAAQQQQAGQKQQARKSGQKASESLQKAAQQMSQSAMQKQQQQDAENLAAMRRAAQDLVSLERATQQNLQSNESREAQADQQSDLAEGVARMSDSLSALSGKTPFMTPKIQQAMGRAQQQMEQSGRQMSGGQRSAGEQSGKSAARSLSEAVNALRQAEEEAAACANPGQGMPMSQGAGKKMSQLGKEQGELNQQSRELTRRMSQQMRMQAGDEAELRRLADEQRRLREQVEQVQRDEDAAAAAKERKLLGRLDQAQREMKEAEELMRQGQMSGELEERQNKILSRLLDATRSINRRDFDPEREAKRGELADREAPSELPADLLRTRDRLRGDLLKADADRYPAHYRALIEAYLRALNGSSR